jgi:hypothetical protein
MPSPVPETWSSDPPKIIVAGAGPYASRLAQSLGVIPIPLQQLEGGPAPKSDGMFDRRLNALEQVYLLIPEEMSAAEALSYHHWIWDWIEKLTTGKDCHSVSFIFIIGSEAPEAFDRAISTSLALAALDPRICGHAIWRRSGDLASLTELAERTSPRDLQALRGRRASDVRRKSLAALAATAMSTAQARAWFAAAKTVTNAFEGRESDIDLFCVPPCHLHGNLLRDWLHCAAIGPVTPELQKRGAELFSLIFPEGMQSTNL